MQKTCMFVERKRRTEGNMASHFRSVVAHEICAIFWYVTGRLLSVNQRLNAHFTPTIPLVSTIFMDNFSFPFFSVKSMDRKVEKKLRKNSKNTDIPSTWRQFARNRSLSLLFQLLLSSPYRETPKDHDGTRLVIWLVCGSISAISFTLTYSKGIVYGACTT